MKRGDSGFSIIEVLVAIVILSIGLLALAQSSGAVTTMIARGKQDTQAAMAAQNQMETMRREANRTPKCSFLSSGSGTNTTPGTSISWTVAATGSADSRLATVNVIYRIGTRLDTLTTQAILGCL